MRAQHPKKSRKEHEITSQYFSGGDRCFGNANKWMSDGPTAGASWFTATSANPGAISTRNDQTRAPHDMCESRG